MAIDRSGPTPPNPPFDKARFWRLLAQYFIGVAVGCVLVGLILSAKQRYAPRPVPPAASSPAGEQSPTAAPSAPDQAPANSSK